jgi:hypothetical protein
LVGCSSRRFGMTESSAALVFSSPGASKSCSCSKGTVDVASKKTLERRSLRPGETVRCLSPPLGWLRARARNRVSSGNGRKSYAQVLPRIIRLKKRSRTRWQLVLCDDCVGRAIRIFVLPVARKRKPLCVMYRRDPNHPTSKSAWKWVRKTWRISRPNFSVSTRYW